MKKLFGFFLFIIATLSIQAQETESRSSREQRRDEKRQRINAMIRQEEEGVLAYRKQSIFGLMLRTDGYGVFYELGHRRTPRFTNLYTIELSEIKHPKEVKSAETDGIFTGTYIYGKINNFYQAKLGFGQEYIFGQKGNKNGIAIMGIAKAGLSMGLLRPYYLDVNDNGEEKSVSYQKDSSQFFSGVILGSSGISKGWNEIKVNPGAFLMAGLRFDFGQYNEIVKALQIGISVEGYSKKVEIMAPREGNFEAVEPQRIFVQGHVAFVFGRRK